MLKADLNGTLAQQWAAKVEYKGPRQADRAGVHDAKRCASCRWGQWETYTRRDGGGGVSLICGELSTPLEKGLAVKERAACIKWEPKP